MCVTRHQILVVSCPKSRAAQIRRRGRAAKAQAAVKDVTVVSPLNCHPTKGVLETGTMAGTGTLPALGCQFRVKWKTAVQASEPLLVCPGFVEMFLLAVKAGRESEPMPGVGAVQVVPVLLVAEGLPATETCQLWAWAGKLNDRESRAVRTKLTARRRWRASQHRHPPVLRRVQWLRGRRLAPQTGRLRPGHSPRATSMVKSNYRVIIAMKTVSVKRSTKWI